MFTDEVEITLKAGNGGPGRVSFFPGKHSGPDGGNGGKGGDLYIRGSNNITNFNHFVGKHLITAKDGEAGGKNNKAGKAGEDLDVDLPVGSVLKDLSSSVQIELMEENQRILVCKGGKGGQGNSAFKSASKPAPTYAQKGLNGQARKFKIELQLLADFGLIGLPNTGKSSLLNELTNANAQVANYPFTTLQPNLGVLNTGKKERFGKIIADIPGLIEGASEGKGLGIKFLKHIKKVKYLLHCISCESEDVLADYQVIIKELQEFDPEVASKPQIILLTKSDLVDSREIEKKVKQLKRVQKKVYPISIINQKSLEDLSKSLDILIN